MAKTDLSVELIETESRLAGFDLLKYGPIRRLVLWAGFPYIFQALMLLAFTTLAVLAWGYYPPEGVPDRLYARTNLVNLAIWGIFWPAIVWIAVLFGRVWCTVCPLELVSNVMERLGRRSGLKQFNIGAWLRAGGLMVAAYALLLLLVEGVHLHRVPAYGSIFLAALLTLATLTGLFMKNRAFCRMLCPVGPLLGIYGRGSMLGVRPGPASACDACAEKHCVNPQNRARLDARSCPSLLNPEKLNSSEECLVCTQCVKVCAPGNMRLLLRRPYDARDARSPVAPWAATIFVMVLSGFVTSQVASEWAAAQKVFQAPAGWLFQVTQMGSASWMGAVWMVLIFPLLLWTALGGLVVLLRGANGLTEAWRRMALPMAIVLAAGHMAKGLAKFVSWATFLPGALRDPDGVATAVAMASKAIPQPGAILSLPVVAVVGVALTAAALYFAVREYRIVDGSPRLARVLPHALLAGGYAFVIFGWGFLQ